MLITIITIIVLIMSVVVHEYSHGVVALWQGDTTARDAGRLTLNPIKHLDPFGSVILPLVLALSGSHFFLAWAKPVPINPFRFRDAKYGALKVAIAGPISNFSLAIFFAMFSRLLPVALETKIGLINGFFGGNTDAVLTLVAGSLFSTMFILAIMLVLINLVLGIFNLMPIPPLDGSRIIYPFLPLKAQEMYDRLEGSMFSLLLVFAALFLGVFDIVLSIVPPIFSALTGF